MSDIREQMVYADASSAAFKEILMAPAPRPIQIALAFRDTDGTYILTVAAMLASVLTCTTQSLHLHILHDDTLTPRGRAKLAAMAEATGQGMDFHPISPEACLPGVDEHSPILRPLTFATLYRLFIPDLPGLARCERLLYLDTDMIVETDLSELWDTDLRGALLGAVPDPCLCGALLRPVRTRKDQWARDVARYSMALGIPMARYFNAGVLLLNLAAIREQRLFDAATQLVLGEPRLLHPDQDALNKVFFDRSMVLPKKFNYLLHTDDVTGLTEGIWHYSGPRKPWREDMPKADRYHHFLAQTPWGHGGNRP